MKLLDATLKTPTWIEVGVGFMVAVGVSVLCALLLAPAIDFVMDLMFVSDEPQPHLSVHQRFFMFLFFNFAMAMCQAAGVSYEKSPRAFWFCFIALMVFGFYKF